MSDLIERLRAVDHGSVEDCFLQSPLFEKAADRIEALEREVEELRAALGPFVEALEGLSEYIRDYDYASDYWPTSRITVGDFRRARTALVKPSEAEGREGQ